MKVGDLVELSAYARKLKYFEAWNKNRYDDIALVTDIRWGSLYTVVWCSDGKKQANLDRRDLRYVKSEKR